MSWIQKLYETYQQCANQIGVSDGNASLEPICHTSQQAHIEVAIGQHGQFLRAKVIPKGHGVTLVPCTEASAGRAGSKPINHPLCDKLQYVAGDFLQFGGVVTSGFLGKPTEPHDLYLAILSDWVNSPFTHPKIIAIQKYAQSSSLVADLVKEKILPLDEEGKLLAQWSGDKKDAPPIFGVMPNGNSPDGAVIRWRVELPNDPLPETWKDSSLIDSWINFYSHQKDSKGLCLVTGEILNLAEQHPAKLRHGADKAKFISANDTSGFTFRGRFFDAAQACGVGFEVTQKAHNALRWLIARQAYRNNDQVIVAWAVSGKPIPDPLGSSLDLFSDEPETPAATQEVAYQGDAGQAFSKKLAKLLAGYHAELNATDSIVVMGLDSATPGRMAITYYRELDHTEFFERIENWHQNHAWYQNFGKDRKFVGAAAPRDIAEAAFGQRVDEKLRQATVERLLPCIVDGVRVPRDLVESTGRRASNRVGLEHWEWEKTLGIACSLWSGYHTERKYKMALELDRTSRDYLYGRLLAVAENIEERALYVSNEKRDTSAAKLMQRFADHPFATWKTIELALTPYKTRLRAKRPAFLFAMEGQLDEIVSLFQATDFMEDKKLSGEFLLGYHCQRQVLRHKPDTDESTEMTDVPAQ